MAVTFGSPMETASVPVASSASRRWRPLRRVVALFRLVRLRIAEGPIIHPTLEGGLFVAVTLLIGIAAINTAAQLLYLLFSLMCAFLVLSAILATNTLRGLVIARQAPALAEAGQPVTVTVRLRNKKPRLASYSLRIADHLTDGTHIGAAFFETVERSGEASQTYECLFPRRGSFEFRRLETATRFPFGLIERRFRLSAPAAILVLPPLVEIGRRLRALAAELGEFESNRRGSGASILDLREYAPGDSSRDIHWMVSARRGVLMVRQYESEEQRRVCLVLDNRDGGDRSQATREDFERALVLAGSVAAWFLNRGCQVELATASGTVGFESGQGHLLRIRRVLAKLLLLTESGARGPVPSDPTAALVYVQWGVRRAPSGGPDRLIVATAQFADDLNEALAFELKAPLPEDRREQLAAAGGVSSVEARL